MSAVVLSKLRILVVDDEPSVGDIVTMLLKIDGHEVQATTSGKEALALFQPGRFDLVFTDFTMPGMNGNQLANAIKTDSPKQPVVMITAHADTMPRSPDVDYVVGKPFQLQHLRDAINKVLPCKNDASGLNLPAASRPIRPPLSAE
jgi:two-component system, NtrC family, response regulator PilR